MDVRAVFFDAGETLVHPDPSFAELFTRVLRDAGHPVDPAEVTEVVSVYSKRFSDAVRAEEQPRLWSVSREASRAFWLDIYRGFVADMGIEDQGDLAETLYQAFSDPSNYGLHADAIPTLERLAATDLILGVISNFEEWLEHLLEGVGVSRFFPVRVISGAVGFEKPDRRIFDLALERAGVAAEETVYVGDHPHFDVEASRNAGMFPVLIDRRGRYPQVDAVRITSLEDLPAAIGLDA
jgi:putative hydrolase of the HAD superfamily